MRIDAHQHYWQIGKHGQVWPTGDLADIFRDFVPATLEADLLRSKIDATIAVQSQPDMRDTDWLLNLADQTPSVAAVVGWADIKAADAESVIKRLAASPKLRGIRPMLQDLPTMWILDPAVEPAIDAMIANKLTFDALIRPIHIQSVTRFAHAHQALTIVVDHAAKPIIAEKMPEQWVRDLAELAKSPNVYCKISGLITEANNDWSFRDIGPYVDLLLHLFGPERTMWGSDWPVILLRGSYECWYEFVWSRTSVLGEAALAAVFGGTAAKVYLGQ
jgi:L-fuconolactonase